MFFWIHLKTTKAESLIFSKIRFSSLECQVPHIYKPEILPLRVPSSGQQACANLRFSELIIVWSLFWWHFFKIYVMHCLAGRYHQNLWLEVAVRQRLRCFIFHFLVGILNCLMCISVYGMQCASTFTLHCSSVASLVRFLVRPRKHLVSHGGIQIQGIQKGPTKDGWTDSSNSLFLPSLAKLIRSTTCLSG